MPLIKNTLTISAIFILIVIGMNITLKKSDQKQCAKYEQQAINYPDFQITNQIAQHCDLTPSKLQAVVGNKGEVIYSPKTLSFWVEQN